MKRAKKHGVLTPTPLPRSAALRSGEGNGSGNGVLPPTPSLQGGGTADDTRRANRWLGLGLGAFTLALLLATAGDIGLTYDEPVYSSRAMRAGQWLGLVLTAPSVAFERDTIDRLWDATGDEQAGLLKLIAWPAAMAASPFAPSLAALRAGTMLIVAVFIGFMFVFLANTRGRLEAAFACLALIFMPRVFTHLHLLTMDAPVMAFSFLAVAAAYLAALHGPEQRPKCWLWVALLGLGFGAAISCKANGWFVPFIVLPWLLLMRRWRVLAAALVSMAILGSLVFLATWPWLWFDTAARVARYFSFFVKHYPIGVEYFGQVYGVAPWHYPLVMLAITTPLVVLGLAVVGVVKAGIGDGNGVLTPAPLPRSAALRSGEGNSDGSGGGTPCDGGLLLLMLWAVIVNLVPAMLPSSPKYNGVRLFLPVFPPLAVLAAAGFGWAARGLATRLARDLRERRLVLVLLLLVALLPQVYMTTSVHPFGMSYYNALIGGLHGAQQQGMEPTYWGDAYVAALPWLNEHAPQGARVWVNVAGFVSSVQIYQQFGMLRSDLQLTGGEAAFHGADLYLVMNKPTELGDLGKEIMGAGKALYVKELDEVPLVWVFGPYK
ncbi:glycosyltransferase family 39 protein [bacterium]|nr:glycosyltransferase family 39 protein [bacterium]